LTLSKHLSSFSWVDVEFRIGIAGSVIIESTHWLINLADTGNLIAQSTGLGGSELDEEWDVLLACNEDAHMYGPSLSKQDNWHTKKGTIAGTAHTQEYLMLHLSLFPVEEDAWCHVKGVQTHPQVQAQIIHRALRVLQFGSIIPAHRKQPWTGYKQSLHLFTQLFAAHPLTGICRPPNLTTAEANRLAEQIGVDLSIRGHSAGSYAGMVWEEIHWHNCACSRSVPPQVYNTTKTFREEITAPDSPC